MSVVEEAFFTPRDGEFCCMTGWIYWFEKGSEIQRLVLRINPNGKKKKGRYQY